MTQRPDESVVHGSRAGQMPRIEWVRYPSQEAAVEALGRGEVHYLESPSFRLLPRFGLHRCAVCAAVRYIDVYDDVIY